MGNPLRITTIIGGIGCGKSTVGEIAEKFFNGGVMGQAGHIVRRRDTSAIIRYEIEAKTPCGLIHTERKSLETMAKGGLVDADLMVLTILSGLLRDEESLLSSSPSISKKKPEVHHIVCGSPRRPDEAKGLVSLHKKGDIVLRTLFVQTSKEKIARGIVSRIIDSLQKGSVLRPEDCNPAYLTERIRLYKEETIPSVDALPSDLIHVINRDDGIEKILLALVGALHLPNALKTALSQRILNCGSNPNDDALCRTVHDLKTKDTESTETLVSRMVCLARENGGKVNLYPLGDAIMEIASMPE